MTLLAILAGTVLAGVGSVWLAAALGLGILARFTQHMLSLAAGALLATAFLHLLPEAFESEAGASELFLLLLVGLVFFFLLDKAELWHHGHEHHQPALPDQDGGEAPGHTHGRTQAHARSHSHAHAHSHSHSHSHSNSHAAGHAHHHGHGHGQLRSGGWTVLAGDSVHAFGDGILIASAFLADIRLGVVASLAVLAHEVPHHMGDLVVLRATSGTRRAALVKVSLAGTVTALGGLVGYGLVAQLQDYLPYFLVAASSSFVYVALADLIPQLQQKLTLRETAAQVLWLLVGMGMVTVVSGLAHRH